jgi:oxalate decarboxylase/phosphoglucose isomerase-like protein (cupin superfamily)
MEKLFKGFFEKPVRMFVVKLRKGEKVTLHKHNIKEEWYVLVEGDGKLTTQDIKTGKLITYSMKRFKRYHIPAGMAHGVSTKQGLIFLSFETPAPDGDYVKC